MTLSRREALARLGGLGVLGVVPGLGASALRAPGQGLATAGDFAIPEGVTYLNSAYTHPMPVAALDALRAWAEYRARPAAVSAPKPLINIKAEFAALINAKESEVCFVPNTSTGENLVVNGLGIDYATDNVVTDALHFEGALLHLLALKASQGLDLRIVKPRDWRIDLEDMEKLVDRKTRLIEVSAVAMDTGFEHDLKAVCDLAHAHGAVVYADIVQAAGNTPIDVKASGVDFCACSSFKWLMGDFGLGFLYVKEALLDRVIHRTQYGYYQAAALESHYLPGDAPGGFPYSWELASSATGHFEVGTQAIGAAHVLAQSLPYLRKMGPENIRAHRVPLLRRLHAELPRLGYPALTPEESTSAIISFTVKDPAPVRERLARAKVNVRVSERYIRISPSVFNDLKDVERLLEALT